jgi:site-specific DNA-cytosine methylase
MFTALEFFAGSGLVGTGLAPDFKVLWANDNSAKKAKVFRANHPEVEFDPRFVVAHKGKHFRLAFDARLPGRSGLEDFRSSPLLRFEDKEPPLVARIYACPSVRASTGIS